MFNDNVLASDAVCHYKQEDLGIEFDIDLSDEDPTNYKLSSFSCEMLSTCYGPSGISYIFTITKDINISNNQFKSGKEYLLQIDPDSFYFNDFTYRGDCPDLGLSLLNSSILVGLDGSVKLTNSSKKPINDFCISNVLDFGNLGAGTIKLYPLDGKYYFESGIGDIIKSTTFYPSDGNYITYKKNNVSYSIRIMEDSKEKFKDMIEQGICPPKDEIYVYSYDNYKAFYISSEEIDDKKFNPIEKYEFGYLIGQIKNPISVISTDALNYKIKIKGDELSLKNVESNDNICSLETCKTNKEYYAKKAIKEVLTYCNTIYSNSNDIDNIDVQDCIAFQNFYKQLVDAKIIDDYTQGCSILSTDMQEKLKWILDILKIVGPIVALGLGTLDFVKAIASDDSDKEMKNAFKRFSTRIAAAVLLFIVPLILAVLMDTFLGNKEGYDSDNPFCNLVDWNENNEIGEINENSVL